MTDLELLKLAAKAAGRKYLTRWSEKITDWDSPHHGGAALYPQGPGGQCQSWNPLTDDGDALRLAVKLRIDIDWQDTAVFPEPTVEAYRKSPADASFCASEPDEDYRRAIVRAAAAIGAKQ
ncbi:MAG: hypothetical protein EPN62_00890 [Candidimonas sp.]|nr:MAG: hypothetical protein EPN77_01890 [Candidimonas sp.]TAM26903.1 MAG: hypothetical protein EPN62_00890 [Candidimonas sp.]